METMYIRQHEGNHSINLICCHNKFIEQFALDICKFYLLTNFTFTLRNRLDVPSTSPMNNIQAIYICKTINILYITKLSDFSYHIVFSCK